MKESPATTRAWIFASGLLYALILVVLGIVCFTFTHSVVRVASFLLAVPFGFLASCFFERIKLGDSFLKSHTGKAGFPGSVKACIGYGTVLSIIASFFIYCAFRF
jgi:hypothetical protein